MKKVLSFALTLALALTLAACGTSNTPSGSVVLSNPAGSGSDASDSAGSGSEVNTPAEPVVLNVAASATPHAEILEQIVPILAEQNITLNIHVYGDYIVPNTAVEEGEEDANYFQHLPYLDSFNKDNGTHLVSVAGIHIEPMGIYAGKTASLDALSDGATIAVPNDPTNEGRALLLLEAQGLIKLNDSSNLEATPNDIVENPKNLKFKELEAAMVPKAVEEVDLSIINVNYALEAGFNPVEDALAIEASDSPYVNIVAVKEGNEQNPAVLALVEALKSETVRSFIQEKYAGAVVAVF